MPKTARERREASFKQAVKETFKQAIAGIGAAERSVTSVSWDVAHVIAETPETQKEQQEAYDAVIKASRALREAREALQRCC